MLITSILILGLNSALRQAHVVWARTENERTIHQDSRFLIDTLRQEVACLYIPDGGEEGRSLFSLSRFPDGSAKFSFLTVNPVFKSGVAANVPAEVTYEYTVQADTQRKILQRSRQWYSGQIAIGQRQQDILFYDIAEFAIEVAGETAGDIAWHDEFEATPDNHPQAIRLYIEWPGQPGFEAVLPVAGQARIETP